MIYKAILSDDKTLEHHGISGQKWGVKHGPPYPLNAQARTNAAKSGKIHTTSNGVSGGSSNSSNKSKQASSGNVRRAHSVSDAANNLKSSIKAVKDTISRKTSGNDTGGLMTNYKVKKVSDAKEKVADQLDKYQKGLEDGYQRTLKEKYKSVKDWYTYEDDVWTFIEDYLDQHEDLWNEDDLIDYDKLPSKQKTILENEFNKALEFEKEYYTDALNNANKYIEAINNATTTKEIKKYVKYLNNELDAYNKDKAIKL